MTGFGPLRQKAPCRFSGMEPSTTSTGNDKFSFDTGAKLPERNACLRKWSCVPCKFVRNLSIWWRSDLRGGRVGNGGRDSKSGTECGDDLLDDFMVETRRRHGEFLCGRFGNENDLTCDPFAQRRKITDPIFILIFRFSLHGNGKCGWAGRCCWKKEEKWLWLSLFVAVNRMKRSGGELQYNWISV